MPLFYGTEEAITLSELERNMQKLEMNAHWGGFVLKRKKIQFA